MEIAKLEKRIQSLLAYINDTNADFKNLKEENEKIVNENTKL